MRPVYVISLLLSFLLLSACSENKEASQDQAGETEPVEKGTVVDPVPTGIPAEHEFYGAKMSQYSFGKYSAPECDPPQFGKLPTFDGTELADLAPEVKVMLEEGLTTKAPNFNCSYHVETWVCSDDCKKVSVWESKTGELVKVFTTSLGALYSPGSSLMILNPPRNIPYDAALREQLGKPEFWQLKDGNFVRLDSK